MRISWNIRNVYIRIVADGGYVWYGAAGSGLTGLHVAGSGLTGLHVADS